MRHIRQPAAYVASKGWAEAVVRDLRLQQPGFRLSDIKGLCQQVGQQQDFHPLLAQRVGEDVMLLTRPLNREHVIEKQLLTV